MINPDDILKQPVPQHYLDIGWGAAKLTYVGTLNGVPVYSNPNVEPDVILVIKEDTNVRPSGPGETGKTV